MKATYTIAGLISVVSLVAIAWAADLSRAQWASFPWMPVFYLTLPVIGITIRRFWNNQSS
ncbi:hypothetical protein [Parvularcula lutaonensis]|uniref:Uncharacterized protein n=1 Tax=Parvularcula lutaonensis TaxID=491923 RepID=A0ABV7MAQ7_9PROT|nr:hypothetical protein [Parvularcula lutaonensis]GGY47481.1 hypothetical protein GCM10007148_16060 [Parvularcula lutaonensis]